MAKYSPSKIESKWQKYWEKEKLNETQDFKGGRNFMLLTEFPYPSGNLHIGHWYAFALPDILGRYLKMNGYNIMYPIGFDAFGLPAENAAIQRNVNPADWTKKNIAYMTKQLKSMGAMFDWSRKVETIDPEYYKWTQWMFLKMHEKGLAYRDATTVNWCPKDKTVLANEQVVNGQCDRCGTEVEQKELTQWMFKITSFADRLAEDLNDLDWPETTKLAQKNWIGRSEGAKIKFKVKDFDLANDVEVFTTRADTIFGATAIVISPELGRDWLDAGWKASDEVKKYIKESLAKRELERQEAKTKTGVYSGLKAINPASEEEIPVWIADYVLGHYGTGAVMFVPAHDQRDFDFAKKFEIPIKKVIETKTEEQNKATEEDGILINSDKFNGLTSEEARKKIVEELKDKNLADFTKEYRLHDWILSRQRYWGVPIPIINCPKCGYIPVPEKELPIKLPKLEDFKPSDDLPAGRQVGSPLAKAEKWLKVKCPKCKSDAERETDTMDTFVDSSWYFLRYTDPKNKKVFADKKKIKNWLPVPMYIGGAEHNTMHLLYSRFFTKALASLGYLDFSEPFLSRRNHGIILGPDNQKMSKSRGNVVDPDVEVEKYGADTVRMYLAFMGPYDQGGPWNPDGIKGISRFLSRVWDYGQNLSKSSNDKEAEKAVNKAIKKVGDDISDLKFNTAISELMTAMNIIEKSKISEELFGAYIKLLSPFAPHLTEELWQGVLGNKKSIFLEKWPEFDSGMAEDEIISLIVQINGKMRATLEVKRGISEEEAKELAMKDETIKKHIEHKNIKKVVFVKDRVVNLVV